MPVLSRRVRQLAKIGFSLAPLAIKKILLSRIYAPHSQAFHHLDKVALFDSVSFELRTRCNGTCHFCPASVKEDKRQDQVMSFELYAKIIGELKTLNFQGRVAFNINNDPLIVPELAKFITFARQELPGAWLQMTTNGKALRQETGAPLLSAGIDEICINWYTASPQEALPENIRHFRDEVLPSFYAPQQIQSGHGPLKDQRIFRFNLTRRRIDEVLTNRAGAAPNKKDRMKGNPFGFCYLPFTQFNLTADGRVAKCCSDFYFERVMGNTSNQSVLEIWQDLEFQSVRRMLLENRRAGDPHCAQCDFIGIRPGRFRSWI
ncbi:MAG: radical SAM/SPASM domain-containing protein, partial [Rhodospirillales bacterium]